MSFQPGAVVYTQGFGSRPENVEVPHIDTRAPSTSDIGGGFFPVGKRWVDKLGNAEYCLTSLSTSAGVTSATWSLALKTLTGDSGGAISPSAGNINVLGTANQIETAGAGADITWSLSATMVAPGSLEVVGLLTGDASATINTAGTALNLATDNDTAAVNFGNGTSARTISIGTSSGVKTIGIGNGVSGNAITIGNGANSSAQTITIAGGASGANSTVSILSGNGTAGTQTLNVLTGTRAGALNLATGAAAHVIAIGGSSAGALTIGSAASIGITGTNAAITVASGTGAINISADAAATTLSIGSGAGAKTVNIGSTNTTSSTNLTAGSGGVNCATDFALTSVATKISMNGGAATDFIGSATLVGGTVTVNNTNIAANDRILVVRSTTGGTEGHLSYTISAGASFTVNSSSGTDTSTVVYVIFRQT